MLGYDSLIILTAEYVMSESSYFTLPQLAERWQVSVVTLRRRIKAGTLKHVAIGRLFRVERDEVERIEREMRGSN